MARAPVNPLGLMPAPRANDPTGMERWFAWQNQASAVAQQGMIMTVHANYCEVQPLRNLGEDVVLNCAIPKSLRGLGLYTVGCYVTFLNILGGTDVSTTAIPVNHMLLDPGCQGLDPPPPSSGGSSNPPPPSSGGSSPPPPSSGGSSPPPPSSGGSSPPPPSSGGSSPPPPSSGGSSNPPPPSSGDPPPPSSGGSSNPPPPPPSSGGGGGSGTPGGSSGGGGVFVTVGCCENPLPRSLTLGGMFNADCDEIQPGDPGEYDPECCESSSQSMTFTQLGNGGGKWDGLHPLKAFRDFGYSVRIQCAAQTDSEGNVTGYAWDGAVSYPDGEGGSIAEGWADLVVSCDPFSVSGKHQGNVDVGAVGKHPCTWSDLAVTLGVTE